MNFEQWMDSVPRELKEDPLWRMEVYRSSLFAADLCWADVTKLIQDKRTIIGDLLNNVPMPSRAPPLNALFHATRITHHASA